MRLLCRCMVLGVLVLVTGCTSSSKPSPKAAAIDSRVAGLASLARDAYDRGETANAARMYESALAQARGMNDSAQLVNLAYNLGVCRLELGDLPGAGNALEEMRAEARIAGESPARLFLLAGRISLAENDAQTAFESGDVIANRTVPSTPAEYVAAVA